MLVTKHLAELCALFIDEIFGELPSRIFATLLNRGRSSLAELAVYTALSPRQLRHGLTVLMQHDLLYCMVAKGSKFASYEANPELAYNLIRTGKMLEGAELRLGPAAKDVMQSLLLLGHTRISDLEEAYERKIRLQHQPSASSALDSFEVHARTKSAKGSAASINSAEELNNTIGLLLETELVELVTDRTYQVPADVQKDIEEDIMQTFWPNGVKAKDKATFKSKLSDRLTEIIGKPKVLKRALEKQGNQQEKRRKLISGDYVKGKQGLRDYPKLDGNKVIRVNYEKCIVELRNRRLVQYANDMIGETTAYVYEKLLGLLTWRVARCRHHPLELDVSEETPVALPPISLGEILNTLETSVDLSTGIGKVVSERINQDSADKIRKHPPMPSGQSAGGGEQEEDDLEEIGDEISGSSDSEMDFGFESPEDEHKAVNGKTNGTKQTKVTFQAPGNLNDGRVEQLRQHLLLLCESKQNFARQCRRGFWTVDFAPLLRHLQLDELDVIIERTSGRHGLRLTHILREKGKLDEKVLPSLALMKKSDAQNKMLEMQIAGFVEVQEVPRDNNRTASRTMFLWFSDSDRCFSQVLDNTYKSMLRCMQVLSVHRQKERDVLSLTRRVDVKGQEKETMEKAYYDKYVRFLEVEQKLLGQVMRLDELVSVLRDY